MGATTNYGLYITDDEKEKFIDFRRKLGGIGEDSNMVKIDAILADKAVHSKAVSCVLKANAWSGTIAPYTQEIDIEGLTANQNGSISVAHNATLTEREIAREAILSIVGQDDGTLTIAADGEMPEFDIPVFVILFD